MEITSRNYEDKISKETVSWEPRPDIGSKPLEIEGLKFQEQQQTKSSQLSQEERQKIFVLEGKEGYNARTEYKGRNEDLTIREKLDNIWQVVLSNQKKLGELSRILEKNTKKISLGASTRRPGEETKIAEKKGNALQTKNTKMTEQRKTSKHK